MNAQAMWPNERPQNERTKAVSERTNKITHERRNKPDNRTSEMPAKQTENGLIARTNARKPGNSKMAEYTYLFSKQTKAVPVWFTIQKSIFGQL